MQIIFCPHGQTFGSMAKMEHRAKTNQSGIYAADLRFCLAHLSFCWVLGSYLTDTTVVCCNTVMKSCMYSSTPLMQMICGTLIFSAYDVYNASAKKCKLKKKNRRLVKTYMVILNGQKRVLIPFWSVFEAWSQGEATCDNIRVSKIQVYTWIIKQFKCHFRYSSSLSGKENRCIASLTRRDAARIE